MRPIHTSDWQIGKAFGYVDDGTREILRNARLEAIGRLGQLARQHGAGTVLVAGVGRIRVRPAIRDRATLQSAVTSAEGALATALLAIGVTDLAQATHMTAARSALAERLQGAKAALALATPGEPAIGLEPGLDALRDHVDAGRSQLSAQLAALGLASVPTLSESDAALERAKAEEASAADALAVARLALFGPEAEHDRTATAQQKAVAAAGQARAALAALEQDGEAALAIEGDEALECRLQTAQVELVAQRERVAQLQRDKPTDGIDAMDARIKRLEGAGTSRLDAVRALREEIAAVTARIRVSEGEGLDEQIAELARQREGLAVEQTALLRDVAVLTLLRDTLAEAEREARERYVAPVLRRVTPYLQGLLPGVEVTLGDDLQVTRLTRQAGAEDLDRLSDGTVERVAVLLRLAYADLLVERGKPAMVILDDALAYSDRHRLETMFDTLTRAAERMQILVLTCRVDAFSRLGGNRLQLVNA